MRKIFIVTAICVYIAGSCILGHCQYAEGDDSAIEQTESQIGQSLDSEMGGEEAPNAVETGEANEEFGAGEAITF